MKRKQTEQLYLSDPYQVSFQAEVLTCSSLANGNYEVQLDRTCFYPESGGQTSDKGTLGTAEVIDVREGEEGGVIHIVSVPVSEKTVECKVDWNVRFDHMQQHTAQHVLSRAFIEICGAKTVSFHMGEETCTIDLDTKELAAKVVTAAESHANAVVWENRKVQVKKVQPDQVADQDLRKSIPAGASIIRLVEIENFDLCPCCGTHVRSAGELGCIKVLRTEKVKNNTRIYFKAGRRAYRDYHEKHRVVAALSSRFTTSADGVVEKAEKLAAENRQLRKTLQKINKKLLGIDKEKLLRSASDHKGTKFVVELIEESDADYLRSLSAAFKSEEKHVVLLASHSGAVVCNASADIKIDLSKFLVEAAKKAGGSGGGSGVFANVSLPPSVDVAGFLKEVHEDVKGCL